MPFEDLTGNSGFVSNSEGVEANLDINVSEDSARNLWDVQAAVQQIAADFQTAVRAAADFNSYLISIRETSQTVNMPSLGMEGGEGGNMSYAGGRVDSGSVPLIQSEINQAQRIGEMEENQSGVSGGALSARGVGRPIDTDQIASQITNLAWMGSMFGGDREGQGASPANGARQYGPGLIGAGAVGRQQQAGGGRAYAASRLIGTGLPAAQQFMGGGGVGGAAAALGRLGAAGAIGYAGYQVIDAGLQTYAQSRALAMSANNIDNGTWWGFEQRVGQGAMAMSPFVSQEEAASIYSNAIEQGWASGRGDYKFQQGDFGAALDFMYGATKDYNMDPNQSAQLLQTNALGAGQSVQALAEQLATLKKSLDGTGISMDVASGVFQDFSSFLIGAGANPADAARIAGGAIGSYAGNTYLGPSGAGVRTDLAAMQSSQVQAIIGGLTGNMPGAAFAGSNADAGIGAYEKIIHSLAVQYSSQSGISVANRAAMFAVAYKGLTGQQLDLHTAESKMMEAAASPNWFTKGQEKMVEESRMTLEHQNDFQSWWHGLDDIGGAAGGISGTSMGEVLEEEEKNTSKINTYNYFSPQVNELLENSGDSISEVVLYGPDGKPVMVNGNRVAGANIAKWFGERDNFNKFNNPSNGYYIQDQSGTKYNSTNIGMGGDTAGATASGGSEKSTVYITLSPQAKQWFDTNKDKLDLADGKN